MSALFIKETCHLQFRYICELIAIGCLVAQGDFETQRAFRDEYKPPIIFKALKNKYPHFFPRPSEMTSNDGQYHPKANHNTDAYGEAQISRLWSASGDHLHRASITTYLKKTFTRPPDLSTLDDHLRGIIELLESHIIAVWQKSDRMRFLQVHLEDGTDDVEAHWLDFDLETSGFTVSTFRASLVSQ